MDKMTKKEWIEIISLAVTILLSIFKNEANSKIIYPIIGIVITIIFINIIYNKTKTNKNLSNTAVISKSKKYTKYLYDIVKENGKILKKLGKTNGIKTIEKKNRKIIKKMQGKTNSDDEKITNLKQELNLSIKNYYNEKNRKYVNPDELDANKSVGKMINFSDAIEAKKTYDIISKNITELRRILLQLEQHTLRIKLGKYIVKYNQDINQEIDAYIDDIGWTNILIGDNKKGQEAISLAISLIEGKLKDVKPNSLSFEEKEEYYNLLLKKARALRHLGTTYYTYKSAKTKVEEYLKQGLLIVNDENFKNFFLEGISLEELQKNYLNNENLTEKSLEKQKKYYAMKQGLEYNMLLYKFYHYCDTNDVTKKNFERLRDDANKMLADLKTLKQANIADKHRYIKLLTFKNQVLKELYQLELQEGLNTSALDVQNDSYLNREKDLNNIERVLNQNIYFDEAMEVYVCQKVDKMYDDINKIYEQN